MYIFIIYDARQNNKKPMNVVKLPEFPYFPSSVDTHVYNQPFYRLFQHE